MASSSLQAPLPDEEKKRLQALYDYHVLDTPPEPEFDDLVRLAAQICGAPMAVVSLVDANRQWFKAKLGWETQETPRELAFCAHAILQSDLLVVPDLLLDERFATNPLVTTDPRLRFYAGAPLANPEGYKLGTLCVLDRVPRELRGEQRDALRALARQVESLLELRRTRQALARDVTERKLSDERLRAITEGTAAVTGSDFFRSLVRHLASALQVRYSFAAACHQQPQARTVAFWKGDGFGDDFRYEVAGTPCLNVLQGQACTYNDGLQQLFPRDQDLVALRAQSYLGVPLLDSSRRVIGHLVVMDDKPMRDDPWRLSIVEAFAGRAGAELERQDAEDKLRAALAEVQTLRDRLQAENVYLQEEIRTQHDFEEIVGNSPALLAALERVEQVAPTQASVLIYGETGTGKELFARAIHSRSPRRERPLVKVNCGAISPGLVESELFGHVKGAYTGALQDRSGRFELADRGTIFLDEVGELPPETQVKLLRVLQEQEFEPVGASRTLSVDVRVIAASNRRLDEAVRDGRFRADLLYRLNVFPLEVPPLRERHGDIPLLVAFFLDRLAKKLGRPFEGVSRRSLDRLVGYPWPGNVRELHNVVERAAILATGPLLEIPAELLATPESEPVSRTLETLEREHIASVLRGTGGVIEGPRGAAGVLGLHPNTLRSRMKKLGVERLPSVTS